MKNIILLTLIIPALSACGIVGTAVDIVTLPIDLIVENDTQSKADNTAIAYTE